MENYFLARCDELRRPTNLPQKGRLFCGHDLVNIVTVGKETAYVHVGKSGL